MDIITEPTKDIIERQWCTKCQHGQPMNDDGTCVDCGNILDHEKHRIAEKDKILGDDIHILLAKLKKEIMIEVLDLIEQTIKPVKPTKTKKAKKDGKQTSTTNDKDTKRSKELSLEDKILDTELPK